MHTLITIWLATGALGATQEDREAYATMEPVELCDGVDNDGDGEIDEGCPEDATTTVTASADRVTTPVKTTNITTSPKEGSEIEPFPPLAIFQGQLVRGLPDSGRVHGWHAAEIGASVGDLPESTDLSGDPAEAFGSALAAEGPLLAVGAPGGNRVYLYESGVQTATLTGGAGAGSSVALGDFDGDGQTDVAVGSASGVAVAWGPLHGSAVLGPEIAMGDGVATGDWNADGLADLAVSSAVGVDLYLGPSLVWEGTVGASPASLAFGDVDLDGADDLVVGDTSLDLVDVYLGGPGADMWPDRTFWGAPGSGTGTAVAVDPAGGFFASTAAEEAVTRVGASLDFGPLISSETSSRRANGTHGVGQLVAADLDGNGVSDIATASGPTTAVDFRD